MKESFILFTENKEQVDMLTTEQAGILLKAIFCYTSDEPLPEMDPLTKMAFSFIRAAIDRTDGRYQRRVESNRENGKLGGRPPKNKASEVENNPKETQKNPTETQKPNGFFQNPPEPYPEPVRDNDNYPGGGGSCACAREDAALDRFCERWGISTNAIGNYSGGKLSGMDWDKVSEKVAVSSVLRQRHSISFFIRNYEKILDGEFDDWEDKPPDRGKKKAPDFDGSRFAGIHYD